MADNGLKTNRQKTAGNDATVSESGPVRLSKKQVILFTEELSDLLEAGLQLESALKVIEERQGFPSAKADRSPCPQNGA